MKLSKINNIELEILNEIDREHGRCIIRSMGPNYYCTMLLPLMTEQKNENKDMNFWKQMMEEYQQKYNLCSKLYNSSFFIQNYSFTYEQHYLKINQEFYPKTLYSIKPGTLSYLQKINIMMKMANILNYLHSQNVCVRTFCPQSLAYFQEKYDFQLKLIWLEEAIQILEDNKGTTNQILSYIPAEISIFVAPEIKFKKPHGFKADVWSLGVIFYQLIFGHTSGIVFQNQIVSVKYPPKFPKFLQNILNSFLHEDPKQRCSLSVCISYFKPLKQCAEATSKMLENIALEI